MCRLWCRIVVFFFFYVSQDSRLVAGVAFKKTFSYAGFEMQPKQYVNPKIALLNVELELKAERDNAEVRIDNVEEYQNVVDAEWSILYDKLDKIVKSGAKVVLSKLPIGDVATQYFADRYLSPCFLVLSFSVLCRQVFVPYVFFCPALY